MPYHTEAASVNEETMLSTFYDILVYLASKGDCSVEEENGVLTFSTGEDEGSLNYVVSLSDKVSLEVYERIASRFGNHPFIWFNYPYSPKLTHLFKANGMMECGSFTGVVYNLMHHISQPVCPEGVQVQAVRTEFHFDQWCEVFAGVWSQHSFKEISKLFRKFSTTADQRITLFLATKAGAPVGCSCLDIHNEIGTCVWDGVLDEYRQQGIASAMLKHRLCYAWKKGCDHMVAQCLDSSLNVYLKEGFDTCCQLMAFKRSFFYAKSSLSS